MTINGTKTVLIHISMGQSLRRGNTGTVPGAKLIKAVLRENAPDVTTGAKAFRFFTPCLCGALLIQDFQNIFGNLLQLMSRFVTLFAHSVQKDCALVTFMT